MRKKQNKNTLKNDPAMLQRYPSVTIEVSKTPKMYIVTIFISAKFSFWNNKPIKVHTANIKAVRKKSFADGFSVAPVTDRFE